MPQGLVAVREANAAESVDERLDRVFFALSDPV